MRYAKIELLFGEQSQGGYIGTLENVVEELKMARDNPGGLEENWRITFVNMDEEEFGNLPEFMGW